VQLLLAHQSGSVWVRCRRADEAAITVGSPQISGRLCCNVAVGRSGPLPDSYGVAKAVLFDCLVGEEQTLAGKCPARAALRP
jgi:hypothetical protein